MRRPHFYFPRYSRTLTPLHGTDRGSSEAGAGEKPLFGSAAEEEKLCHEACTGKIYLTGFDRHHRPVVVFDNAVQNTKNTAHNLDLLVSGRGEERRGEEAGIAARSMARGTWHMAPGTRSAPCPIHALTSLLLVLCPNPLLPLPALAAAGVLAGDGYTDNAQG